MILLSTPEENDSNPVASLDWRRQKAVKVSGVWEPGGYNSHKIGRMRFSARNCLSLEYATKALSYALNHFKQMEETQTKFVRSVLNVLIAHQIPFLVNVAGWPLMIEKLPRKANPRAKINKHSGNT